MSQLILLSIISKSADILGSRFARTSQTKGWYVPGFSGLALGSTPRLQLCGALEALCKHCHISFMGSTLCSSSTSSLLLLSFCSFESFFFSFHAAVVFPSSHFGNGNTKIFLDKKKMHWCSRRSFLRDGFSYMHTVFENTEKVSFSMSSEASYVYISFHEKCLK